MSIESKIRRVQMEMTKIKNTPSKDWIDKVVKSVVLRKLKRKIHRLEKDLKHEQQS